MVKLISLLLAVGLSGIAGAHDHAPGPAAKPDYATIWLERQEKAPRLAIAADFDADGRLWLARTIGKQLWVNHSDDAGRTFSSPVLVNQAPELISADGESRPQIAAIGREVYVSWTQALPQPFAGHIRFAASHDSGTSFSEVRTINDDTRPITHRFNAMLADRNGVTLAWIDKRDGNGRQDYTGAAIYTARSVDGGRNFEPNRKLADHSCECCRLGIAADRDGVPVVFWRHVFGRNVRDFALARVGSEIQRASHDGWEIDACPHHGGALAIDDKGGRHIVWFTGAEKTLGLHYRRVDGEHLGRDLAFGNPDHQAAHPMLATLGDTVQLVWREYDGKLHRIMGMSSSDRGEHWSAPNELANTTGAADDPLVRKGRGGLWLVWNTAEDGLRIQKLTP